ncbi:hypothetical protein PFICI_07229 [Pestalotiopsis fici W106-1]|uniref:RING-type domain-containing protein n=1 Tax=Pestalotiopsis fici (strain W106-1 / CGMCC3.15140) TaxID=1229662 RepID=W3XA16_PESFW|nr:uncharacterized protein PFICI_07229 [Pestalotiopsis fici W106-1]ETS82227.1 hypothetical protein PFICI_07229 [Pestalotiopsis fici W106-1]
MVLLSEHELTTDDDWQKELTRAGVQLPVLYALKFWRVVLDESHQIRNMRTLRSKACHALQRVKSWCVSGTPYINSIWDIYSQLNFVGDEHAKTRVKFKARYCNTEEGDLISLNEKIGPLMIRRTSRDSRFGKPIIPEIEIERIVIKIPLSSGEKAFTKVIEEFFKDWAEEAKKAKNPVPGLALLRLLRLRQNTSSPFMLESFMVRTIPKARLKILKSRLAELEVEMRDVLPNLSREMDETQALSTDKDRPLVEPDSDPEVGEADMGELFDMAIAYKTNICGTCSRQCVERQVLECGHVFCKPCIFPNAPREAELTLWAQCPGCKNLCPVVQPYDQNNEGTDQNQSGIDFQSLPRGIEEEKEEEEDDDSGGYWTSVVEEHETGEKKTSKSKKSKKGQDKPPERRPGYDYRGSHPSLRKFETHWLQIGDKTHNIPLIRRGKIGPCADLCDRILKKQPGDKIIAFTQFNQEAAMIGRLLQNLDIPFLYFNGKMTPRQTDEALKEMAENSKMKVMIVGLKCGGESLNCQFANHAILIGPYWNNAGEEQAIGRIARLGQKKKVFVYRLDASGTADDEVNLIQERKRDEAAELMGDVPAQYHAPTKD